jgi:alkylation response protein AidB-like acyl-CoA dehydrogenase
MDFELSKEQREIKGRAAAFVEEVCRPLEATWGVDDYAVPHDVFMNVVRKFREYGFRGLAVPKEAGGQGLGTMAKCLLYEEIVFWIRIRPFKTLPSGKRKPTSIRS